MEYADHDPVRDGASGAQPSDPRCVRVGAGWSQARIAFIAAVCTATVRVYELRRDAVTDPQRRRRLDNVYRNLSVALRGRLRTP